MSTPFLKIFEKNFFVGVDCPYPCYSYSIAQPSHKVKAKIAQILGKFLCKIFFKKSLTNLSGCGIMENSARGDPSRAAEKRKEVGVSPYLLITI